MKTQNFAIVLCIAFLMQSCEKKETGITFRLSEEVTCEQIDTLSIGFPIVMVMNNDNLFIVDFHEPMIIHYNLQDKKFDRFLYKGRGPGETMPPITLYANPCDDNKLYRYSKQEYTMGFYPLDSLSLFVPLFKVKYGYYDVIPFEKDRYLAAVKDDQRYSILNSDGEVIDSFGDWPDFFKGENLIPFDAKSMFHQVRFVNSYPKKKIVAVSTHVLDIIDYSLNVTNASIKRVLLAPYDYDYGSGSSLYAFGKDGIIIGVSSVTCDDQHIYLLLDSGIIGEENIGVKKEIWILDWNGQPEKKLILDVDIMKITAYPLSDNQSVFGLAYESNNDDEYYKIVKVNFNMN